MRSSLRRDEISQWRTRRGNRRLPAQGRAFVPEEGVRKSCSWSPPDRSGTNYCAGQFGAYGARLVPLHTGPLLGANLSLLATFSTALLVAIAAALALFAGDEFLDPPAVDRLAGVKIALRVLGDGVQERELAVLASWLAEPGQNAAGPTIHDQHLFV